MLVEISPVRASIYRVDATRVYNTFRFDLANRSRDRAAVIFSIEQLPTATLAIPQNPVAVAAGQTARGEFEISRPLSAAAEEVDHFTIVASPVGGGAADRFPMTFLSPAQRKSP